MDNKKRLKDSDINDMILKYINSDREYAILINGKWGTGKTYYTKNNLIPFLKKSIKNKYDGIIYISLYGIKTLEELEEKIVYAILEEMMSKNNLNKKIIYKLKSILNIGINYFNNSISIIDTIKLFQNISKYIIILDDLERCDIDLTESFGYINNLVEHKNVKMILVSNQDKLLKHSELYYELKEKVIGEMIIYNPSLEDIIISLCKNKKSKSTILFLENYNYIHNIFEELDYHNIRTLKLVFIKFDIIASYIKDEIIHREELYKQFMKDVLIYLIYETIKYKEGLELENWDNIIGNCGRTPFDLYEKRIDVLGFRFIDDLLKYSIINSEVIMKAFDRYKEIFKGTIYDRGNTFDIIVNFFGQEDEIIENNLILMEDAIKNNIYDCNLYPKILASLIELKKIGFDENVIYNIINMMEKNIVNMKIPTNINFIPTYFGINKVNIEYENILAKWKEINHQCIIEKHKKEINELLMDNEWGIKLIEYCKKNKYVFQSNRNFFANIDLSNIIKILEKANSSQINYFKQAINEVYDIETFPMNGKKDVIDYYENDLEYVKELIKMLNVLMDKKLGKMKMYEIKSLIELLYKWADRLSGKVTLENMKDNLIPLLEVPLY